VLAFVATLYDTFSGLAFTTREQRHVRLAS